MTLSASTRYSETRARHYALDMQRYYRLPVVQVSLQIVLSLFIIAFFLFFAFRPTLTTIVTLQKDIDDSKQTLQTLDTKVSSLQRAAAILTALKPSLPYIDASIPSKDAGYTPFVSSLEVLAAQNNVQIVSENVGGTVLYSQLVSPFAPLKSESVIPLPVVLQVSGSYDAIANFLQSLLSLDRLFVVSTATFSHEVATKNSTATVSLSLTGNVYYLADQAQITKAMPTKIGVSR